MSEAHHVFLDALRQCLMGLDLVSRQSSFYGHKMKTHVNTRKNKNKTATQTVILSAKSHRDEKSPSLTPFFLLLFLEIVCQKHTI